VPPLKAVGCRCAQFDGVAAIERLNERVKSLARRGIGQFETRRWQDASLARRHFSRPGARKGRQQQEQAQQQQRDIDPLVK
jgi:hypothetical protein